MHVPSTPSVTAAKPSARPAGIADLRQQLAGADRGHVDAEEEVAAPSPCDRRPRRGSSSRRRARPAAAADGWSGRWCRCCRRSCRGFAPARRRSARRPRRGSAGRAPRSTRRARCRSSSRRSRACRRAPRSMPFSSSMRLRSISASGEPARAFITLIERLAAGERARAVVARRGARPPLRETRAVHMRLHAEASSGSLIKCLIRGMQVATAADGPDSSLARRGEHASCEQRSVAASAARTRSTSSAVL